MAAAEIHRADVLPADLAFLAGVDLRRDEPIEVHRVEQVGAGDAVEPGLDTRPAGFDDEVVPVVSLNAF